jgi:hypothetical protein
VATRRYPTTFARAGGVERWRQQIQVSAGVGSFFRRHSINPLISAGLVGSFDSAQRRLARWLRPAEHHHGAHGSGSFGSVVPAWLKVQLGPSAESDSNWPGALDARVRLASGVMSSLKGRLLDGPQSARCFDVRPQGLRPRAWSQLTNRPAPGRCPRALARTIGRDVTLAHADVLGRESSKRRRRNGRGTPYQFITK